MSLLVGTNKRLLSIGILLFRCAVGLILFVAGAGKVFGWFGGMGLKATIDIFDAQMGIHPFWTYLSCYTELIGGFLLMPGLLTRPAAFALFINMLVATIFVGPKNFFMGGGAYPFSLMISSLLIVLSGPMLFSLDAVLFGAKKKEVAEKRFNKVSMG